MFNSNIVPDIFSPKENDKKCLQITYKTNRKILYFVFNTESECFEFEKKLRIIYKATKKHITLERQNSYKLLKIWSKSKKTNYYTELLKDSEIIEELLHQLGKLDVGFTDRYNYLISQPDIKSLYKNLHMLFKKTDWMIK